jgi:hypothetical protein
MLLRGTCDCEEIWRGKARIGGEGMGDEDDSRGTLVVEVDGDGEALDAGYGAGEGDLLVRHHERRIPYGGGGSGGERAKDDDEERSPRQRHGMGWRFGVSD